ncbi:unnamed protein product, partial [Meganyctiphanes norvegica]
EAMWVWLLATVVTTWATAITQTDTALGTKLTLTNKSEDLQDSELPSSHNGEPKAGTLIQNGTDLLSMLLTDEANLDTNKRKSRYTQGCGRHHHHYPCNSYRGGCG